jgi:hypothetical protein
MRRTPTPTLFPDLSDPPGAVISGLAEIGLDLAKLAFSIREFCHAVGIGRTLAYTEINAGRLVAVRCGRRTLIRASDALRWLASLPQGSAREPAAPRRARVARRQADQRGTARTDKLTSSGHRDRSKSDSRGAEGAGARPHRLAASRAAEVLSS